IHHSVKITASIGNQEAQRYAMDFVGILRRSGCAADLDLPTPGLRPDIVGVQIGVRDIKSIPESASQLGTVLDEGRIAHKYQLMESAFFPDASVVLVIGAKDD